MRTGKLRRVNAFAFLCVLLACRFGSTQETDDYQDDRPNTPQSLKLEITRDEKTNTVSAQIVNNGKTKVMLVNPGDGSSMGRRTPTFVWSVLGNFVQNHSGKAVLPKTLMCGNLNPLQMDEIFEIGPGQSREIRGWLGVPSLDKPGLYRLKLYYRNEPLMGWTGSASNDSPAWNKVRRSTACSLISNELIFTVEAQTRPQTQ